LAAVRPPPALPPDGEPQAARHHYSRHSALRRRLLSPLLRVASGCRVSNSHQTWPPFPYPYRTDGEIPLALLAFNVGIELGQLAFVASVMAGWHLLSLSRAPIPSLAPWAREVPVYAMGTLAAFWCLERAAALLS
jgi:hypothetical protein